MPFITYQAISKAPPVLNPAFIAFRIVIYHNLESEIFSFKPLLLFFYHRGNY